MATKKCIKCGFCGDPIDDFYARNAKCKRCVRANVKALYIKKAKDPKWLEDERKRCRIKDRKRIRNKDSAETKKAYLLRYPEKYKAQISIQHIDKKDGFHFHHWSYNDDHMKDVIELSSKQHNKAHRFLIYDQERKMYRTTDGVLLDTKDRHTEYVITKIQNESD